MWWYHESFCYKEFKKKVINIVLKCKCLSGIEFRKFGFDSRDIIVNFQKSLFRHVKQMKVRLQQTNNK